MKKTFPNVMVLFMTAWSFYTFVKFSDQPDNWRFYASLVGFLFFLFLSVIGIRTMINQNKINKNHESKN